MDSVEPCKVEYCTVDACRVDWTTSVFVEIVDPVAVENNSAVADIDEPNKVEYCNVVVVIVEPCSVELDVIIFAVNCEIISVDALSVEFTISELDVRFCVVIVEPVMVVLTAIVSVIIDIPVAVLYDRFWLLIEPDCALNTLIVDPDAVEKFKLRTLI